MFNKNRKGQAAMEFLMTYGWAILAAVIVIGVLAYFGVFSPGKLVPEACTLSAPLGCNEARINSTAVTVIFRNGVGETVDVRNLSVGNCGSTGYYNNVSDGTNAQVSINCAHPIGSTFKGDLEVTWIKSTGTFIQTASGTITGKVVP